MDIRIGAKDGRPASLEGVEDRIRDAISERKACWTSELLRAPHTFEVVERAVHDAFREYADECVAGLLQDVTQRSAFEQHARELRGRASRPLRAPDRKPLTVRLLGGLCLYITTLYSGPMPRTGKNRGKEGSGLYLELSALRFLEDLTPALASEIARKSALLPAFELARIELARQGIDFGGKKVHRSACLLARCILTARKRDLIRWRRSAGGKGFRKGSTYAGKRVAVAIDGGRVRLREQRVRQIGRGHDKVRPRSWRAEWREPKQFVIYELDEKGRMKKGTRPYIDGTLQGPDALMELLAMRLYQQGVVDASEVVFVADGGTWIWNRISEVARRAGLPEDRITKVLDFYHGVHHIHLALKALTLDKAARARAFQRMRNQLYRGRVDLLLKELRSYRKDFSRDAQIIRREIAYFQKHAAHMNYAELREHGRPMGSGAIKSVIRRVLNQRLKGNGIQWTKENAEAMMVLRGIILADRLDETLDDVRATMASDRQIDWQWSSPDMREELIPDEADEVSATLPVDYIRFLRKGA